MCVCVNMHVCAKSCERQSKEMKRLSTLIPCKPIHTHGFMLAKRSHLRETSCSHSRAHMLLTYGVECARSIKAHNTSPLPSAVFLPIHSVERYAICCDHDWPKACKRWLWLSILYAPMFFPSAHSGWSHNLCLGLTLVELPFHGGVACA